MKCRLEQEGNESFMLGRRAGNPRCLKHLNPPQLPEVPRTRQAAARAKAVEEPTRVRSIVSVNPFNPWRKETALVGCGSVAIACKPRPTQKAWSKACNEETRRKKTPLISDNGGNRLKREKTDQGVHASCSASCTAPLLSGSLALCFGFVPHRRATKSLEFQSAVCRKEI